MTDISFQRVGAASNAHAGADFERISRAFFQAQGIFLEPRFPCPIGIGPQKKLHKFDLGSADPAILVECKSHKWTVSGNTPSAKITVWNEAMLYFIGAPQDFRKIMFVLKHSRRDQTLAQYYIKNYSHFIPNDVEFWEYCEIDVSAMQIR
ncbi:hypothetical protein [Ancylobacter terrae]|uniref:hypothetical protein n=1 Tax=Ancylobacter sp. sgz301288 TaxID=3342077 RepID=UPI00385ACB14